MSTTSITPFLWFHDNAAEALAFYTELFPGSSIVDERRGPDGALFTATFELAGRRFMALNGGPVFTFNEAVSFFVSCEDQAEVDRIWDAFSVGGSPQRCGWIKDRFGVSWQVIPKALETYLGGADRKGAARAQAAMMKMIKLDVEGLKHAYEQGE